VAALSGALIAAVTAGRRQRTQLRRDAERQQDELRHDRELAELSELRGVLDDASRDISNAERGMFDATHAWIYESVVSDALQDAMRESFVAMWGSAQRIRLRVGSDEVHEPYWEATHLLNRVLAIVETDAADHDCLERIKLIEPPRSDFIARRDAFFEEAYRRYGSRGLRRD
jgi:hypothetical protein